MHRWIVAIVYYLTVERAQERQNNVSGRCPQVPKRKYFSLRVLGELAHPLLIKHNLVILKEQTFFGRLCWGRYTLRTIEHRVMS